MTDIRYLNDTSEYLEGVTEFKTIIPSLLENNSANIKNLEMVMDIISGSLFNNPELDLAIDPLFIFSFSESENQLSQWRAYGKYAIEFDMYYLKETFGSINKCIYTDQENHYLLVNQ